MTPLAKYSLPSIKGEGWAEIVISSDGFFSTVSDWGNYGHLWHPPKDGDFRKFLVGLNSDYVWSKLSSVEVWDEFQVEKNVKERLDSLVTQGKMSQGHAETAFEEAEGRLSSEACLLTWLEQENIPDDFAYHEGVVAFKKEPQSWNFVTQVFPRFQEVLRQELAGEADGVKQLAGDITDWVLAQRKRVQSGKILLTKHMKEGHPHDPRSREIYKHIADLDFREGADFLSLKSGGEGDNGEHLMYLLDDYFAKQGGR